MIGCIYLFLVVFFFFLVLYIEHPINFLYSDPGTDLCRNFFLFFFIFFSYFFFFALLRSALLFGRWAGGILNINVQLMIKDILSIFFKSIYI